MLETCLGMTGDFSGTPEVSINNCVIYDVPVPQMKMQVHSQSDLRTCGWHQLEEKHVPGVEEGCVSHISKSIQTLADEYRGFVVVKLECPKNVCDTVWEIAFQADQVPIK